MPAFQHLAKTMVGSFPFGKSVVKSLSLKVAIADYGTQINKAVNERDAQRPTAGVDSEHITFTIRGGSNESAADCIGQRSPESKDSFAFAVTSDLCNFCDSWEFSVH